MEFWVELALSVLFRFLRQGHISDEYLAAFTKLYEVLGDLLEKHDELPPPNGVKG